MIDTLTDSISGANGRRRCSVLCYPKRDSSIPVSSDHDLSRQKTRRSSFSSCSSNSNNSTITFSADRDGFLHTSTQSTTTYTYTRDVVNLKTKSCRDLQHRPSEVNNRKLVVENLAALWVHQQMHASCDRKGLQAVAEKLSSTDEQLDVLELDGMELLDHDQELGESVLRDPDSFATEVMDSILSVLHSNDLYWQWSNLRGNGELVNPLLDVPPARGSRLWIRLTAVPVPLLHVDGLHHRASDLTSIDSPKQLVHVYGVVYAISTVRRTVFRQRYVCKICRSIYDLYYGAELLHRNECCHTWVREDIESHDYLRHQELLLGPVPSVASTRPFSRSSFTVSLFDDLTGRLQIGDSVSVIGHATTVLPGAPLNLPPSGYRFAELKIIANNIFTPFDLSSLRIRPPDSNTITRDRFCSINGGVSLDRLSEAITNGFAYEMWPKLLPLAFLLSLVSCKVPATQVPLSDRFSLPSGSNISLRKRIHILLTADGHASGTSIYLFQAAGIYADRCVCSSDMNDFEAKWKKEDQSGDKQMAYAGDLEFAKGGVLIVDVSILSKQKMKALCNLMEAGTNLTGKNSGRSDYRPGNHTTIWASTGTYSQRNKSFSNYSRNMLVKGFDIVLQEHLGAYTDGKLLQSLAMRLNKRDGPVGGGLGADIQQHLIAASSIASVTIGESAHKLIQSYYLSLRCSMDYTMDLMEDQNEYASIWTLQSLLRVAESCARLYLRKEIQEMPDATLAILLCEESEYKIWQVNGHSSSQVCDQRWQEY